MDNQAIQKRFREVMADLEALLGASGGRKPTDFVRAYQVQTEAINLLGVVCGASSPHGTMARKLADFGSRWEFVEVGLRRVLGAVGAARRDFEGGFLRDLRAVVTSEVLDDLLETAASMTSDEQMAGAAALLAVSVLEDTLRRLCLHHGLDVASKASLDSFNSALKSAGVYDKPTWRQIQTWGDHRNVLAHGNLGALDAAEARRLIEWTSGFLEAHASDLGPPPPPAAA